MRTILLLVTFTPWVAMYFVVAYFCLKEGILKEPSAGMSPSFTAMGQTMCAMWIFAGGPLLAFLAMLLGVFGSLGITIMSTCFVFADMCGDSRLGKAVKLLLWIVGFSACVLGLKMAMPYSTVLPPAWAELQKCIFCN